MTPDRDALKAPESNAPELIPSDPDQRRERRLKVPLVSHAKRRQRVVYRDSNAREKLEDAAREIHGPVAVTPTLASNVLVGEMIQWQGRPYTVAAVCGRKKCAPNGWTRLEPVRLGINHNQVAFAPIIRKCDHRLPVDKREVAPAVVPTVKAQYGEKDQGSPLVAYERAESLREQYVSRQFRLATVAWDKGDQVRERIHTNLAQRADVMSDDEWLTNRKVILGR